MDDWMLNPTMWVGLFTLIILEIVLGIDNLLFITILVNKLPPKLNNKARITGLICALVTRIILLFSLTSITAFTNPIISFFKYNFSARDLLMLSGGFFLFFKAFFELNERIKYKNKSLSKKTKKANFWYVVTQIIVLDVVFSLDSVITAIGMIESIVIMIIAIIIGILLMIIASDFLIVFINKYPKIIILCLTFLLMIGIVLIAEGFGYLIPKSYLYFAIIFSIIIEIFNQFSSFNRRNFLKNKKICEIKNNKMILELLDYKIINEEFIKFIKNININNKNYINKLKKSQMFIRLLRFEQRSVNTIMIPKYFIKYIDIKLSIEKLYFLLNNMLHTKYVIIDNKLSDEPIGIVCIYDILKQYLKDQKINLQLIMKKPLVFNEKLSLHNALRQFYNANIDFAFVADKFGCVKGILTLTDLINNIIGDFFNRNYEINSRYYIKQLKKNTFVVNGLMSLEDLIFYVPIKLKKIREYETISGLLMEYFQKIPDVGESIRIEKWIFKVFEVTNNRLKKILIIPDSTSDFNKL